jgi:hypothetical protein
VTPDGRRNWGEDAEAVFGPYTKEIFEQTYTANIVPDPELSQWEGGSQFDQGGNYIA